MNSAAKSKVGSGAGATKTVYIQKTNHILHLLLSIVTLGIWLPVWLVIGISGSIRPTTVALVGLLIFLAWLTHAYSQVG